MTTRLDKVEESLDVLIHWFMHTQPRNKESEEAIIALARISNRPVDPDMTALDDLVSLPRAATAPIAASVPTERIRQKLCAILGRLDLCIKPIERGGALESEMTDLYAAREAAQQLEALCVAAEEGTSSSNDLLGMASVFELPGDDPLRALRVERCAQRDGPPLWAVRRGGNCFSRGVGWEFEPMPSSRDDDFIARARYATRDEAFAAAEKAR